MSELLPEIFSGFRDYLGCIPINMGEPLVVPCRLMTYRLVESISATMKKHHSSHLAYRSVSLGTRESLDPGYF